MHYIALMSAPLYNSTILRLASSIPHQARLPDAQASVERRGHESDVVHVVRQRDPRQA